MNPDNEAAGIVEPRLRVTLLSEHATRPHKTRSNEALLAAPIRPATDRVARGLLLIDRSSHAHEPTLPTTKKAPIRQFCASPVASLRSAPWQSRSYGQT